MIVVFCIVSLCDAPMQTFRFFPFVVVLFYFISCYSCLVNSDNQTHISGAD